MFAANALLIAPTSRKDCGVTASLLFARCVRECVLSSAEEEYAEMSVNGNNEENETDSRRKKKGELFLPKALFVCHRDALESKTFAAPSVALADAKRYDDDDDDDDDVDDEEQREDISTIARGIHHVESSEKSVH